MVALNFKSEFALAVEAGRKCRSIRAPRKDGRNPKPGDALQLYTGMRQRTCRKLRDATCVRVTPVLIHRNAIILDGRELSGGNSPDRADPSRYAGDFAHADGFGSFGDMTNWFAATHGLPFSGLLIEWNPPQR